MNLSERQQKLLKRTFLDYQQTLGFIQNPLIIHRAEGISGIFVATLGHRHPRVMTAKEIRWKY